MWYCTDIAIISTYKNNWVILKLYSGCYSTSIDTHTMFFKVPLTNPAIHNDSHDHFSDTMAYDDKIPAVKLESITPHDEEEMEALANKEIDNSIVEEEQ